MRDRNESALRVVFDPAHGQALVEAVPSAPSADAGELPGLDLTLAEWESDSFSFSDFDRYAETLAADAAGGNFEIRLSGETCRLAAAARQVALRCQRLAGRRNAASRGELFDRVLACHRRFRDLPLPSAAAAHAHALDTWQWMLRLDPEASLALQLAALFHEAWRLTPEIPETPARRGAWMTDELLAEAGLDLATRVRVHRLLADRSSGRAAADPANGANGADDALAPLHALLDDAEALSCCSLGTSVSAPRMLARLRPALRVWLRELRLHGAVARLLATEPAHGREDGARLVAAPPAAGYRSITAATMLARKRLAAGMAGGAGIAPTRVGALLARAALLGDLAAHPVTPPEAAAARALAAGGAKPALAGEGAGALRARRRLLAIAAAKPARAKRSPAASCRDV